MRWSNFMSFSLSHRRFPIQKFSQALALGLILTHAFATLAYPAKAAKGAKTSKPIPGEPLSLDGAKAQLQKSKPSKKLLKLEQAAEALGEKEYGKARALSQTFHKDELYGDHALSLTAWAYRLE